METSVAKRVILLAIVMAIFTDMSSQQYAWRPQGRFGKRRDDTPQIASGELFHLADSSSFVVADTSIKYHKYILPWTIYLHLPQKSLWTDQLSSNFDAD